MVLLQNYHTIFLNVSLSSFNSNCISSAGDKIILGSLVYMCGVILYVTSDRFTGKREIHLCVHAVCMRAMCVHTACVHACMHFYLLCSFLHEERTGVQSKWGGRKESWPKGRGIIFTHCLCYKAVWRRECCYSVCSSNKEERETDRCVCVFVRLCVSRVSEQHYCKHWVNGSGSWLAAPAFIWNRTDNIWSVSTLNDRVCACVLGSPSRPLSCLPGDVEQICSD